VNDVDDKVYVGSTKNIADRWRRHYACIKTSRDSHYPVYVHMRTIGLMHFRIEKMLDIEVETKEEARKVEDQYIKMIPEENRLNAKGAWLDKEQYFKKYREENAEQIKAMNKKYREENAEKRKQYDKKYYEENKEKERERRKKYREENAEKEKERHKKYYEENKERKKKKMKEAQKDITNH